MANDKSSPAGSLFTDEEWQELSMALRLSPRQAEIVHALMGGLCDKQIALEVGISVPTVRTHLTRLFAKFDVEDRTELILHVFRCFRTRCHQPR